MTGTYPLTELLEIRAFMFAGNSTFTLLSKKTETRFTYKLSSGRSNQNVMFVRIKTSADHWTFIGTIFDKTRYVHSKKTNVTEMAPSVIAIKWFLMHLTKNNIPKEIEFWHEGKCGKCGRALTDPISIKRGLGPSCAEGPKYHTSYKEMNNEPSYQRQNS